MPAKPLLIFPLPVAPRLLVYVRHAVQALGGLILVRNRVVTRKIQLPIRLCCQYPSLRGFCCLDPSLEGAVATLGGDDSINTERRPQLAYPTGS